MKKIDLDLLASSTTGMSGADIANMVNRAGIEAVKSGKAKVDMQDLIDSQETVMMGRANKDTGTDHVNFLSGHFS